eukprot:scaffold415132_cov20-Attheya_sp.AAC.1
MAIHCRPHHLFVVAIAIAEWHDGIVFVKIPWWDVVLARSILGSSCLAGVRLRLCLLCSRRL